MQPVVFQNIKFVIKDLSLKYISLTESGFENIGIRKLEFVFSSFIDILPFYLGIEIIMNIIKMFDNKIQNNSKISIQGGEGGVWNT